MKSKTITLPDFCYALLDVEMADPSVKVVTPVIIKLAEQGYYKTDWYWNKENALAALEATNGKLGVSAQEALMMEGYSMFGWPDWAYQQKERSEETQGGAK